MNISVRGDDDLAVGIDVGGTNLRAALIGRDGRLCTPIHERVRTDRDEFAQRLRAIVDVLDPTQRRPVGIGLPGRVNPHTNLPVSAGYLDIAGLPIADLLGSGQGRVVCLDNDAVMALRAELALGAARGVGNAALLTIGTGIGGAYALHGRIVHGRAFAGQFGHVAVQASGGERCNCGRIGCVETTSSGSALGRLLTQAGLPPETRASHLVEQAASGDALALDIVRRWATPLRAALESISAALDPDMIVLGGGLGRDALAALDHAPPQSDWFAGMVRPAALGDEAGVIGAGLLALDVWQGSARRPAA